MDKLFFTRNAIPVAVKINPGTNGVVEISRNGEYVHKFHLSKSTVLDVSEILDAFTPELRDPLECNRYGDWVYIIEDSGQFAKRTFSVGLPDVDKVIQTICAFRGGISRQNILRYWELSEDADVFSGRLLVANNNFFWTNRSADWRFRIPETELEPLIFIKVNDVPESMELKTEFGVYEAGLDRMGVFALDLSILRSKIIEEKNALCNIFEVWRGGKFACKITIEEAPSAIERATLRFRNSLGVYERFDLVGQMREKITQNAESSSFMRYESSTMEFIKHRLRQWTKRSYENSILIPPPDKQALLLDMLSSDEVWLLSSDNPPCRVIPSVEELNFDVRQTKPEKVNIILDCIFDDSNISPDILGNTITKRRRIFENVFNTYFN